MTEYVPSYSQPRAPVCHRTCSSAGRRRIRHLHANMEATGLPGASCDLVTATFVVHECPPSAIRGLIAEARRLLRPGGVLMLADNNPRWGARVC